MPRLPRNFVPGVPQHVIQRGNNRQAIFIGDDDRSRYLSYLAEAAARHLCAIHAYVLMNNHVHLLATPSHSDGLSRMMQGIGRRYVRYFNDLHERSGTLWEGRFRAALVDSERYLLTCMRYIELNPVRAGMASHPRHYRWSSYRHNARGETSALVTQHDVYLQLGTHRHERQVAYRALFDGQISDDELTMLRLSVERGEPLGTRKFIVQAATVLGRRVTKHAHGGDRKSDAFATNVASSDLTP